MILIDADIFASELDFADADVCEEFPDGYCEFGFSRENIRKLLRDALTVDAVPVVRCRECKYWGDEDGKLQRSDGVLFARCKIHNYLLDGRHTGWCPTENDFCSYGERKEGAGQCKDGTVEKL